jgi:hypothetical protein
LALYSDRPYDYETKMVYYRDLFDNPLSPFDLPHIGVEALKIIVAGLVIITILISILIFIIKKIVLRSKTRSKANDY